MKFLTKKQQLNLFEAIVKKANTNPSKEELGDFVSSLFAEQKVLDAWNNFLDVNNLTKEEQAIMHAYNQGWKLKMIDNVYWYEDNNVVTNGPFHYPRDKACHVFSRRTINKLITRGLIPKNYPFYQNGSTS